MTLIGEVYRSILERDPSLDSIPVETVRSIVYESAPLLSEVQAQEAVSGVFARLHGLGPLEELIDDPSVSEVMVNGPGWVWVERDGRLERTPVRVNAAEISSIIERIVAPLGLRVDRTSPIVDARLPDGSRVNVVVPPVAIDGPYVSVRRFRSRLIALEEFCEPSVGAVLRSAVLAKKNIVVSGGTGAGKTSLLNALAHFIAPTERVVTIEDAAELQLPGEHVVRLETRPSNGEGVGEAGARLLLRNALRMRPDRIIVGEVRGAEALEMVQAMNTGHSGSLSTCHANSPVDALRRLETMLMQADVGLPLAAVRDHLWAAVDVIVQVARFDGGHRRVETVVTVADDGSLGQPC